MDRQRLLCFGDLIALYDEDYRGYLMSYLTSTAHNEIAICANQSRASPAVPNSAAIVFQIFTPAPYKYQKKVARLAAACKKNPTDLGLQAAYQTAMQGAKQELLDHTAENQRLSGKEIVYGQLIQLRHCFSNKWVHANPIQLSRTEHQSMKVELRDENSKSAHFQLMPSSKVNCEGEEVQVSDVAVFQSIKCRKMFLHCSTLHFDKENFYSTCYETNLSAVPSRFILERFQKPPPGPDVGKYLKGGQMIRLYHRQVEAYLTVEGIDADSGQDIHLRVRTADPMMRRSTLPSTSAINYWQIERTNLTDGRQIMSDDVVRLRHVVNRTYLMVDSEGSIKLSTNNQDPNTLFSFHVLVQYSVGIQPDDTVRIQHVQTGFWLHGDVGKAYVRRKERAERDQLGIIGNINLRTTSGNAIQWSTAQLRQIAAVEEQQYDDAFSIEDVEEENVNEVNYVAGMVPLLKKMGADMAKEGSLSAARCKKMEMALKELARFVYIDEVPCKRRQKLLRNFMIVDLAVQLLKFRTKPKQSAMSKGLANFSLSSAEDSSQKFAFPNVPAIDPDAEPCKLLKQMFEKRGQFRQEIMDCLQKTKNLKMIEKVAEVEESDEFEVIEESGSGMTLEQAKKALANAPSHNLSKDELLEPVFSALLGVLQVYVDGESRKNELYLGRHIDFFLGHIDDNTSAIGLGATQMMVGLMKNNRTLIECISDQQLERICGLVEKQMNYRHLELLCCFCCCNGAAITSRQNFIADQLIRKRHSVGRIVFLETQLGQDIGLTENCVYVRANNAQPWKSIQEIKQMSEELYLYFKNQLSLMNSLCTGRNSKTVNMLSTEFSLIKWQECFYSLTNDEVPDEIREIYCKLLYNMFINIGTNYVQEGATLVYDYNKLEMSAKQKRRRTFSATSHTTNDASEEESRNTSGTFMADLRKWINKFLDSNKSLIATQTDHNVLIAEVLILVKNLVLLNSYTDPKEIEAVLETIMQLLDGSDDLPSPFDENTASADAVELVAQFRNELRYKRSSLNTSLDMVRMQACEATEQLFDMRINSRLFYLIHEFKQILSKADQTNSQLEDMFYADFNAGKAKSVKVNAQAMQFLKRLMKKTDSVSIDLSAVVIDLCRYESDLLANAMSLIQRYYSSYEELFKEASKVQILITEESLKTNQIIVDDMKIIQPLLADRNIDNDDMMLITKVLDKFVKLCYLEENIHNGPHPINQQILVNYGILNIIFDILSGSIESEKSVLDLIHQSCVTLLQALAHGNLTVQKLLYDQMPMLLKCAAASDYVPDLYIQIFTENATMCMNIGENLINNIISEMAQKQNPNLCRLLTCLLTDNGKPLKKNQQAIAYAICQNSQSLEIVTEYRTDLIIALLEQPQNSKKHILDAQMYLCNCVELLATFCQSGNKTMESLSQQIFTVSELLDIIRLPDLPTEKRAPFLQFFNAIYLQSTFTGVTIMDLIENPKFIAFIQEIADQLIGMIPDILENQQDIYRWLQNTNANSNIQMEKRQLEIRNNLIYVILTLLPFITEVFKQYSDVKHMLDTADECFDSDDNEDPNTAADEEETEDNNSLQSNAGMGIATLRSYLLHSVIIPFGKSLNDCFTDENHLQILNDCLASLSSVDNDEEKPEVCFFLKRSNADMKDPLIDYANHYAKEIEMNLKLCNFVEHLQLAYSGQNTLKHQIGFPSLQLYTNTKRFPLPLGPQFQELVNAFIDNKAENATEMYANVAGIIRHLNNSLHMKFDNKKAAVRMQELNVILLKILRTIIHNKAVIVDANDDPSLIRTHLKQLEDAQIELTKFGIVEAIEPFLSCITDEWIDQALATSVCLSQNGNKFVQDRYLDNFLKARDEPFFNTMKTYMREAIKKIHDTKMLVKKKKMPTIDLSNFPQKHEGQNWLKLMGTMRSKHNKAKVDVESQILQKPGAPVRHDCLLTHKGEAQSTNHLLMEYLNQNRFMLVMQLLHGMCQKQPQNVQDYMRYQWDNVKNIDLIEELCFCLPVLVTNDTDGNLELTMQLLQTITCAITGNEDNQMVALNGKVIENLNLLLQTLEGYSLKDEYAVKKCAGLLYRSITELNSKSGNAKLMMNVVNKDLVKEQMLDAYKELVEKDNIRSAGMEDLVMEVGFIYHHLLCRAFDLLPSLDKERYTDNDAWSFFQVNTKSIELVYNDTLQRVHFAVEDKDVLRENIKEEVKWKLDRSSPSNKHRSLMAWASAVCCDIRYQRKVQLLMVGRVLINNWTMLNLAMLMLTYMINMIILFGWTAPEKFNTDIVYDVGSGQFWPVTSPQMESLIKNLGLMHNLLCFLLVVCFFMANRPYLPSYVHDAFRWILGKVRRKPTVSKVSEPEVKGRDLLSVNLLSPTGLYYPMLFGLSAAGTFFGHDECFAVHMLHIATINQLLNRVIQSVTINGRSMLYVSGLTLIFFYIYALVGFMFLRNIYIYNEQFCETLYECTITTLRLGLLYGLADSFDVASVDDKNTFQFYALKAIFDISFYALITTIMLNVFAGITIDTFSQLREEKLQAEEDMQSVCFICNRENFEFEHEGTTFDDHIHKQHNMWSYVFFLNHLSDIPVSQLSALEFFVHRSVESNNTSFFPLGQAMALKSEEDSDESKRIIRIAELANCALRLVRRQQAVHKIEHRKAERAPEKDKKKSEKKQKKQKTEPELEHATYGPFAYSVKE